MNTNRGNAQQTRRILVAHGTRSARGIATTRAIRDAVAARLGPIDVAYVDVLGPSPSELLTAARRAGDERPTVLVPCFLAAGFHVRVDVPRHVQISGHPATTVTVALGPDPALAPALRERLTEAGWRPGDRVILGATGSSDARARLDVQAMATMLAAELDAPVPVGYLAAGLPVLADVLARVRRPGERVFLASYQLADGLFHDRLAALDADGAAAPLGIAPQVIDLIEDRFRTGLPG